MRAKWVVTLLMLAMLAALPVSADAESVSAPMVRIPAGSYYPFFLRTTDKAETAAPVPVDAFALDEYPVTNKQFIVFVHTHPEWRRSQVKSVFADAHYLDHWGADLKLSKASDGNRPVTNISWFAAKTYCESKGKSLPTTDQWEYALADAGRNQDRVTDRALAWYSVPNAVDTPAIGTTGKNGYGIDDLVGLVWEWTLDFNSFMVGSELRNTDGKDKALFCGGGSLGVKDATDYAAFMRYSMRSSLKAADTTHNLGFRCAKELP